MVHLFINTCLSFVVSLLINLLFSHWVTLHCLVRNVRYFVCAAVNLRKLVMNSLVWQITICFSYFLFRTWIKLIHVLLKNVPLSLFLSSFTLPTFTHCPSSSYSVSGWCPILDNFCTLDCEGEQYPINAKFNMLKKKTIVNSVMSIRELKTVSCNHNNIRKLTIELSVRWGQISRIGFEMKMSLLLEGL